MAALTVDGSNVQQPYLFPAPATTAGRVIGGFQLPTNFIDRGYILVNHQLKIIDPTPASSGFLPPPGNPTQKATLHLSPSRSILQEAAAPYISPGTNGNASFVSYNSYNPSSTNTFLYSRHMSFRGTYPAGGGNAPSLVSTPWDSPTVTWNQHGSITSQSSSTQYLTTSDYRMKENVSPIENGLDYILALRPRKFTWKESGLQTVGFIAHEIQEDVPLELSGGMVQGEKDSSYTLVNLYMNDEIMLDENGQPIVREKPNEVESQKFMLDGITWKIVSDEPNMQAIDTLLMISPLVSSVQQLKAMFDAHENRLCSIENDILNMESN